MPTKPSFKLQERYVRRRSLTGLLFDFPGLPFLVGLAIAVPGACAAVENLFTKTATVASGVSAVILIGFTVYLSTYFIGVLRFWLRAPVRLVPYFERRLNAKSWDAFKSGFALAQSFIVLERRATQLGVMPLSTFGFGDDMLGQFVVWHPASTGLETVRALVASSQRVALDAKVLEDLEALETVLARAEAEAVRFAMVLRIGKHVWILPAEIDQRKGSFC